VRKVGVILDQFKQENKEKLLGPNDEPPTNDLERITVTIYFLIDCLLKYTVS
jgi:hypothetical protein